MSKKTLFYPVFACLIILTIQFNGCSGASQSKDNNEEYVFDDAASDSSFIESVKSLTSESLSVHSENDEAVNTEIQKNTSGLLVQAGAFKSQGKAQKLAGAIEDKYNKKANVVFSKKTNLYIVTVGSFKDEKSARKFVSVLKKNSIEAFLIK